MVLGRARLFGRSGNGAIGDNAHLIVGKTRSRGHEAQSAWGLRVTRDCPMLVAEIAVSNKRARWHRPVSNAGLRYRKYVLRHGVGALHRIGRASCRARV